MRVAGVPLRSYCLLWQEGPVVCKIWLSALTELRDIVICKFAQTAVRRMAAFHQNFQFGFVPSRMKAVLRRFFARLLQATLQDEALGYTRQRDSREQEFYTAVHGEVPDQARACDAATTRESATDAHLASLLDIQVAEESEKAAVSSPGHSEDGEECPICFLLFSDPDAGERSHRKCCYQPICEKCNDLCHGKGQPCSFCRHEEQEPAREPAPAGRRRRRRG